MNATTFHRLACATVAALATTAMAESRPGAIDAGVTNGSAAASKAVSLTAGQANVPACVKLENGQVRLADERGCNPSEASISLRAGNGTPLETNRFLTVSPAQAGLFGGIFGGLQCPSDRTLVSGGFDVIYGDMKIVESFIGPGFGLPRVYIVFVFTSTGTPMPAGDMVRMWATCL